MGTSAPEAAVSVTAAVDGSNGIAIGNVIGSNIFNLLMVLGISAIIKPLYVNKRVLKVDYPVLLISIAVVGLMSADFFIKGVSELNFSSAATAADSNGIGNAPFILDRIDGIILLAMFAGFISMVVISTKKAGRNARERRQIGRASCRERV